MTFNYVLDFEKEVLSLEEDIERLRLTGDPTTATEIASLQQKQRQVFQNLGSWERVQLARHHDRPYFLDYMERMTEMYHEMHGDRAFADDRALIGGMTQLGPHSVMMLGHQKGRDTKSNIYRNFGMANPEGYRKAMRLMHTAAKFHKPVVTLVDTPGAFPGKGSEERGVAEAIARNLYDMAILETPIISVITGEGGSGGALGIAVADRVLMLENSIYSVISPEGCASILFRDAGRAKDAAKALKITSADLLELGLVDGIIEEPAIGAHRDHDGMAVILKKRLIEELDALKEIPIPELVDARIEKFNSYGRWQESEA
jgi:acetyl-CoA carboxylase carboxyl transferase subunit alpha